MRFLPTLPKAFGKANIKGSGLQPKLSIVLGKPALAGLLSVALLAACGRQEAAPDPIRAVRTMKVSAGVAGMRLDYAAEVKARTETRLAFRVGGKMVQRQAEIGQRVRAGQVLAQIDPTDLRLAQQASQAALRAAQASFELAESELRSYRDLRRQGFISALELDRRETGLEAQRAQLDQARAQSSVQGNQAGYAQLLATAAGVVTAVEAEVGAVLGAGTPVLRLAHDGARDAVFAVPEDMAAGIRSLVGKKDALQVRAWGSQQSSAATVREVAAAADPVTRTFQVKADLGSSAVQLGQTLTVSVAQPERAGVMLLPLTAVMAHKGQSAVWLLDASSMTVQVQPVVVAGADGNSVVVASGLSPGQTVVTAGVHTLAPGQKVKLYQAPAASAASTVDSARTRGTVAAQPAAIASAVSR